MTLLDFLIRNRDELARLTLEHLLLVLIATGGATLIGVPVGVLLTRRPALSKPVLAVANVLQTIPSLALFGFLIPLLGTYGIGKLPAIIALFLYSLLPIIRNTFTGIRGVDPAIREAARGMGMTDRQLLTQVELPLALSVILAGVRVATVISVGTATIAAAIGAGGLGVYIFRGLRIVDQTLILAGAIPAALLALGADFLLGIAERTLAPGRSKRAARVAGVGLMVTLVVSLFAYVVAGRSEVDGGNRRIVVGSKDFTEQVILGELIAQQIEEAGFNVDRRFELGGDACHRAMLAGQMDVYVEYTGTAFTAILKHQPVTDPRRVFEQVRAEYASRFGLEWLEPLGFENTFAILVRGDVARRLNLKSISDVGGHARGWRAGFGQDFMSREDGYPGFARAYGLRFAEAPLEMDLSLSYRALASGQVDLIAGNSTDGLIEKLDLVQLEDDRRYFPPYEAAAIARRDILEEHPQIAMVINELGGRISAADMRALNYAVDSEKRDVRELVREFRAAIGPGASSR